MRRRPSRSRPSCGISSPTSPTCARASRRGCGRSITRRHTLDAERLPHPAHAARARRHGLVGARRAARPRPATLSRLARRLHARSRARSRRAAPVPRILARCPYPPRRRGVVPRACVDPRFEIRVQCGRALLRWKERGAARRDPNGHGGRRLTNDRVFAAVAREVDVGRGVWQAQQSVVPPRDGDEGSVPRPRGGRARLAPACEHVFTLLSLVLPRQPRRGRVPRALRRGRDPSRHGARVLESVLPPPIRERLWPYSRAPRRAKRRAPQPRGDPHRPVARQRVDADPPRRATGWGEPPTQ